MQQQTMSEIKTILRFITAGSVDDGKSTLIGRLFYDADFIPEDQLEALRSASERKGLQATDLSLYTDGLRDERIQGITIDVAYRYFSTKNRKFIIADTPGHIQYTRNMVTAASSANLAIILIDARKGVTEQTRRHSYIASLLRINHVIVCINKMDLVEYNETRFQEIVKDYMDFASKMDIADIQCIPVSAIHGDNIVKRSDRMLWYQGATLLYTLENIHVVNDTNHLDLRIPVQTIIRSPEFPDFRGYAGKIVSGVLRVGDELTVLPSGLSSRVVGIDTPSGKVVEAFAPQTICISLDQDIDISRGDMLVRQQNLPEVTQEIDAMVCWFGISALKVGNKYILRHTTKEVKAIIKDLVYKVNLADLKREHEVSGFNTNDIGKIKLRVTSPVMCEPYRINMATGSFILIDEGTNHTVAAGIIV